MDPDKVWLEANSLMTKRKEWEEGKYMRGVLIEEFTKKMKELHPHISTSDVIFLKCLDGEMEMNRLKEMLAYLRQIKRGKSKDDVDKKVGEVMANRYIKPIVDKLDKENKENENKIEEFD